MRTQHLLASQEARLEPQALSIRPVERIGVSLVPLDRFEHIRTPMALSPAVPQPVREPIQKATSIHTHPRRMILGIVRVG